MMGKIGLLEGAGGDKVQVLNTAKELGADEVINIGKNDPSEEIVRYVDSSPLLNNPEVIFGTHDNSELLKNIENRTGWNTITAVKNRKIFILDDDIVSRPGPRMINALGLIAKNLYPDIYKSYFNTEDPLLW